MIKINSYLRNCGLGSRRKVEEKIKKGEIIINDKKAKLTTKILPNDRVKYKGKILIPEEKIYLLLNKPKSCISARISDSNLKTVVDLIKNNNKYIFPVGRLDINTTGLLLLTNDGKLTNFLLHPRYKIERVYKVKLSRPLSLNELQILNSKNGIMIFNKKSFQKVTHIEKKLYEVKLWSGFKNHVKMIFKNFGIVVWKLQRISFANIKLGSLKTGESRFLKKEEIEKLLKLIKNKNKKNVRS